MIPIFVADHNSQFWWSNPIGPFSHAPSHMSTCISWFRGKVWEASQMLPAWPKAVPSYLTQRHDVDRFYMVGRVLTIQEWVLLSPSYHSVHHSYLRHLRLMGMWCLRQLPLVPSGMATWVRSPCHRMQRNGPCHVCSSYMYLGLRMVRPLYLLSDLIILHSDLQNYEWVEPNTWLWCIYSLVSTSIVRSSNLNYTATHIAGKLNTAADTLSRDRLLMFHSLLPRWTSTRQQFLR